MLSKSSSLMMGLLLFFSAQAWGQAGPPLIMDDPGTPGAGKWEIFVATSAEFNHDESKIEAPLLDANYGIGEHIELTYEVPFVITGHQGEPSESGFDRYIAAIKYRFIDKEDHGFSASVYPQLTFVGPGASSKITQDEKREIYLPIEFEEEYKGFEFDQEIGYRFIAQGQNQVSFAVAATHSVGEGLLAMVELNESMNTSNRDHLTLLNLGGEVDLKKWVNLVFSGGKSLRSFDDTPTEYIAYFGLQFLF